MGNIGMKELVVILLVVLLVFGAKKLKNIGADLGAAVRGFKKSMADGEEEQSNPPQLRADAAKDAEFPESGKAAPQEQRNDRRSA